MPFNAAVDAYIEKSQPFAQPILHHLRELIHKTCPEVEEQIKWGMPGFSYQGPLCGFAAFKAHCSFGFWKAALMSDPSLIENAKKETAMGHLGRITSLKDLPPDKKIIGYIKEAMRLNEDGIKVIKSVTKKPPVVIPPAILTRIKKNKLAYATFEAFPPSHKREYIQWITEAKTEATKEKRIAQMMEWLEEGKDRNWKYRK